MIYQGLLVIFKNLSKTETRKLISIYIKLFKEMLLNNTDKNRMIITKRDS